MRGPRWLLGRLWDLRAWRPANAAYILRRARRRGSESRVGRWRRIEAAAGWLSRAQDATDDGGVAGRYRLDSGWTSSYPETTGYLVPTFLSLEAAGLPGFEERAHRAVAFLLDVQLPSGGFPGGELAENRTEPSIFNTAQILNGLVAWSEHADDEAVRTAAERAGVWLVSNQDDDGAWRRHVYRGLATTYTAHAACWLAEAGTRLGRSDFRSAAERHLDWVLQHRDSATGWIDLCGFSEADHRARRAVTHTIAYTLWGVLMTADLLGRSDGIAAVARAADAMGRLVETENRLPGMLDHSWRPRADWACVTGNCQMALVWLRLAELDASDGGAREARSAPSEIRSARLSWANRALVLAGRSQSLTNPDSGIRGGLPGSDPVWGDYIYGAFPNWAAKFFIDGMLKILETAK